MTYSFSFLVGSGKLFAFVLEAAELDLELVVPAVQFVELRLQFSILICNQDGFCESLVAIKRLEIEYYRSASCFRG